MTCSSPQFSDLSTRWILFFEDYILLTAQNHLPTTTEVESVIDVEQIQTYEIAISNSIRYRAAVLKIPPPLQGGMWCCDLRESFYVLPRAEHRWAGKAKEILYWDRQNQFCGTCGHPLRFDTPISKSCPNCNREHWANVAIAVIVLVERPSPDGNRLKDEILLVQSHNFKRDFYGLVAGFVETGETLEEAVVREVFEETGITISNLRYCASQPWPYPNVLMAGFRATYAAGSLSLQTEELRKGGWFSRDDLPIIPGRVSLARQLIEEWKTETANHR